MEGCLLCLELNSEFVDCIKVDSTQWQELNIKNLIEKHLWIMEYLLPSSWLCNTCWQALYEFHKFYMRIEEAHMDFGKLMPKDLIDNTTRDEIVKQEGKKNVFDETVLNESCLEPEILIDQLSMEDKPIIKEEEKDQDLVENLPFKQKSKRGRRCKDIPNYTETTNQDPLEKSKSLPKRKNKKNETIVQTANHPPIESIFKSSESKSLDIKQDPDILKISNKSDRSSDSSDNDDLENFDIYTDEDYKPEKKIKRSKRKLRKKTSPTINSFDSDDSNTDDEQNSEENENKQPKKNYKERDQFLADNFKMSCVLCNTPMTNFKSLMKHFETEHKIRGYAFCCNKKFYERGALIKHIHLHINPDSYKCNQCGKLLNTEKSLENHKLLHVSEEEKKFSCPDCGKNYVEQKQLTQHINRVHLRLHDKICDICGKNFSCIESFKRHILEHDGKLQPDISCDVCGLLVTTKHGLRRHKTKQHPVDGHKDYVCNVCFKVSPNGTALRNHINYAHKKDNNLKCTMCGKGFKRKLALREHMATHTGVALYTCPWCPKTFNANASWHVHRKTQHPVEFEDYRRQKKLERYKRPAVNNTDGEDFKVDLPNFDASANLVDSC